LFRAAAGDLRRAGFQEADFAVSAKALLRFCRGTALIAAFRGVSFRYFAICNRFYFRDISGGSRDKDAFRNFVHLRPFTE